MYCIGTYPTCHGPVKEGKGRWRGDTPAPHRAPLPARGLS